MKALEVSAQMRRFHLVVCRKKSVRILPDLVAHSGCHPSAHPGSDAGGRGANCLPGACRVAQCTNESRGMATWS